MDLEVALELLLKLPCDGVKDVDILVDVFIGIYSLLKNYYRMKALLLERVNRR